MMKKLRQYIIIILFIFPTFLWAEEGMWIPSNIPDSIFKQMQMRGLKLSKLDIYNPDSTSIIDAVPMFGKGCSSGVISSDGLIITNFHCARYFVQSHSTVSNNLLEKGFSANSLNEELTNSNLTVEFTRKIYDVTASILKGTDKNSSIHIRDSITKKNISLIEKHYTDSLHYKAVIEPIFFGNKYLLYLRQEFKDIRLVYSPPESIADFGGEKDNWMWPRQSADFAIFRIYCDSQNTPQDYSKNNVPYIPKKYFTIDTTEKKENNFSMVIGYPGNTEEYLPTKAIETYCDSILPIRIFARKKRLEIMKHYMDSSKFTNLNYSSKYATTSNYYLKWLSDQKQLYKSKKSNSFKNTEFVDSILEPKLNNAYSKLAAIQKIGAFYFEGLLSMDVIRFANKLKPIIENRNEQSIDNVLPIIRNFFKTYSYEIDQDFYRHIINDLNTIPKSKNILDIISESSNIKKMNQYEKVEMKLYNHSILIDSTKLIKTIKKYPNSWKLQLERDNIYSLSKKTYALYAEAEKEIQIQKSIIDSLQRENISRLFQQNKVLYSDANSTIRISYGNIKSYESADGITFDFNTTMNGIKEKYDSGDSNYIVDKYFLQNLETNINTCIISTCHTTGGNSGSPVINQYGKFVGLNFDRNVEGTTNDFFYRGNIARNIWVDSQYIYFLLKNYSQQNHILHSLKISK